MTEIVLYTAAPEKNFGEPVARSARATLAATYWRASDVLRWSLRKDYAVHYEAWRVFRNTNRGDHAIRRTIEDTLASQPSAAPAHITEVEWGELTEEHVARLNDSGGLFVIAGGGYLFFDGKAEIARRFDDEVPLIERITCPRIAYGIGINQLRLDRDLSPLEAAAMSERTRGLLRRLAGALDLISVRDEASARLMQPMAPGRVRLTGDPALFMEVKTQRRPGQHPAPLVGLNFALHGPWVAATVPARMQWIVPLAQRLQAEWGCSFRYMLHSDCERVFPMMLRQNGIRVELVDAPVEEMFAAYAELDLHICQMLHSSIFAVAAGVPTINIGYDTKNLEFFSLMDIEGLCIPTGAASAEAIFALAHDLLRDRSGFDATIAARKRALAAEHDRFVTEIDALMRQRQDGALGASGRA
jgi:hypothetical protein